MPRRRIPLAVALALAAAGGLACWAAFPSLGLWWAAPLGVAALVVATAGRGVPAALALGLVFGVAFEVPLLSWAGVYLEADAAAFAALERRWVASSRVRTVHAVVEPDTVQALFAGAGVPEEPDVVSIDVDGNDYWIWRALTRYRPRTLVIEYNGALDPGSRRVMPYSPGFRWDHTSGYGASLGALEDLGAEKGYRLVHTELAGVNAFFVREDLADGLPAGAAVPRRSANHALLGLDHPPPRRELGW